MYKYKDFDHETVPYTIGRFVLACFTRSLPALVFLLG